MRLRAWLPVLGLLAVLTSSGTSQTKDAKEVAELLPAQTMFCVEVSQPDKLAKEIQALVKGSALDEMPATLARFRAKLKEPDRFYGSYNVRDLGMFFSPEVLRDLGKLRGGAFAVTGFTKEGPDFVAVLLTGESGMPRVLLRGELGGGQIFIVHEVAGVPIYRHKSGPVRNWKSSKEGGRVELPPLPPREYGPAMAMTPGMIVMGSSKELVGDAILRSKGKSSDATLASLSAYKDAAKLRTRPGLFFYADPAALDAQIERLAKQPGGVPRDLRELRAALPSKGVRHATGMLALQNGQVDFQARLHLAPGAKDAFLDALPTGKADTQLLAFAPRGSFLAAAAGIKDGAASWKAKLALLDRIAAAGGSRPDRLPSKNLKAFEEKSGLEIAKDVAAKVVAAGLVFALDGDRASGLFLVRAKDAASATFLAETALPKLVNPEAPPKGTTATVLGQSVTTYADKRGPSLSVGRRGAVLVVGDDSKRVAAALLGAQKKTGTLTDPRVAAALEGMNEPVAVGVVSLAQPLLAMFKSSIAPSVQRYYPPKGFSKDFKGGPPMPRSAPKPPEFVGKGVQDMTRALSSLAPMVLSLERKGNTIVLEARQPGLRGATTRIIDVWVEGELQRSAYRAPNPWGSPPPIKGGEIKKFEDVEPKKVPAFEKK